MDELTDFLIKKIGTNLIFWPKVNQRLGIPFIQVYKRSRRLIPFVRIYRSAYVVNGIALGDEYFYEIRDNEDNIIDTIHKNY